MTVSRRGLLAALGVVWLVDAILQFKPAMFTQAFIQQMILPNAQSQPVWIVAPIEWAAGIAGAHIVAWNAFFATIQLTLGLALVFDFQTRLALIGSFIWSFVVWWAGEGFGGLLTGTALLPSGAPGAIVFYVLVGIVLWPEKEATDAAAAAGRQISEKRVRLALWSLVVLWFLGAALQLQPAELSANGLGSAFSAPWMARHFAHAGFAAVVLLTLIDLAIAVGLLIRRVAIFAAWASIAVSLFFWWTGQDFGQMTAPLGTDPNSGPLWVLLTLCAFPGLFSGVGQQTPRPD